MQFTVAHVIFHHTVITTLHILPQGSFHRVQLEIHYLNSNLRMMLPHRSYMETSNPSSSYTAPNNVLAYRPNFANSNTAILFINLEAIFPCYRTGEIAPACQLFTYQDRELSQGKPYIQISDIGNNFHIFSNSQNIATYGFGFMGCPKLFRGTGCQAISGGIVASLTMVCLLPRALVNECGT